MKIASRFLFFLFFSLSVNAHTFHEGMSSLTVNEKTGNLEIVHRFTTHDLIVMLSKITNTQVRLDDKNYETLLINYWEKHFSISQSNKNLTIDWIGIDKGINETTIYQEIKQINSLKNIKVSNNLLIDFYSQQINRLNYDDEAELKGTLIFRQGETVHFIKLVL